jgi:hypothetical protein
MKIIIMAASIKISINNGENINNNVASIIINNVNNGINVNNNHQRK